MKAKEEARTLTAKYRNFLMYDLLDMECSYEELDQEQKFELENDAIQLALTCVRELELLDPSYGLVRQKLVKRLKKLHKNLLDL